MFAQRWSVDRAKIIEDRTEGQEALRKIPGRPPGNFTFNAKMLPQQEIAAECWKRSSAYVLGKETRPTHIVGRGAFNPAAVENSNSVPRKRTMKPDLLNLSSP